MRKKIRYAKFVQFLEFLKKLGEAALAIRNIAKLLITLSSIIPLIFTWMNNYGGKTW